MAYKIVFSEAIATDLQENINWYNQRKPGLGTRFYKAVKLQLARIKKTPLSTALRYDNVRCATVKDFPFLIHYTVDRKNATIYIISVFSTFRDPETVTNRPGR